MIDAKQTKEIEPDAKAYCAIPSNIEVVLAFKEENGEAVFMCRDYGIGIPTEEQAGIFQPFFRASNAKKEREGTGLGLFIVKKFCDELGRRVWFESEINKGTIFYVSLPLSNKNSLR